MTIVDVGTAQTRFTEKSRLPVSPVTTNTQPGYNASLSEEGSKGTRSSDRCSTETKTSVLVKGSPSSTIDNEDPFQQISTSRGKPFGSARSRSSSCFRSDEHLHDCVHPKPTTGASEKRDSVLSIAWQEAKTRGNPQVHAKQTSYLEALGRGLILSPFSWWPCRMYRRFRMLLRAVLRGFQSDDRIDFIITSSVLLVCFYVAYTTMDFIFTGLVKGTSAQNVVEAANCSIVYVTIPGPIITVSLIAASPTNPARGTYYYSVVNGTTQWLNSVVPPRQSGAFVTLTSPLTPSTSSSVISMSVSTVPPSTLLPVILTPPISFPTSSGIAFTLTTTTSSGDTVMVSTITSLPSTTSITTAILNSMTPLPSASTAASTLSLKTAGPYLSPVVSTLLLKPTFALSTLSLLSTTAAIPMFSSNGTPETSTDIVGPPGVLSSSYYTSAPTSSPDMRSDGFVTLSSTVGVMTSVISSGPTMVSITLVTPTTVVSGAMPSQVSSSSSLASGEGSPIVATSTNALSGGGFTVSLPDLTIGSGGSGFATTITGMSPGPMKTLTASGSIAPSSGSTVAPGSFAWTSPTNVTQSSLTWLSRPSSGTLAASSLPSNAAPSTFFSSSPSFASASDVAPSSLTTTLAALNDSSSSSTSMPFSQSSMSLTDSAASFSVSSLLSSSSVSSLLSSLWSSGVSDSLALSSQTSKRLLSSITGSTLRLPGAPSTVLLNTTSTNISSTVPSTSLGFSTALGVSSSVNSSVGLTTASAVVTSTLLRGSNTTSSAVVTSTLLRGSSTTSTLQPRALMTKTVSYGDASVVFVFPTPTIVTSQSYWTGIYPTATGPDPSDLQTMALTTRSIRQTPLSELPWLELFTTSSGFATVTNAVAHAAAIATEADEGGPAEGTECGESGNFTLSFDDSSVGSDEHDSIVVKGMKNPYHHLFYANGFTYVPDKWEPYPAMSQPNVAMFLPLTGRLLPNTPFAGTLLPGEIGAGPRSSVTAYWFNAYSGYFGCALSGGTPCTLRISGYRYDAVVREEVLVVEQNATLPACYGYINCRLTRVFFNEQFRGLSGIQFNAFTYRAGIPQVHVMDDLQLGWYNNSCSAGIWRIGHW
ncbi:hypothetical protein SVAN01_02337 [Stagonosporopsis vannaccii]|nr:hypothetical protein SVAN01_02337 [Stagonosporopsis vannaccii]